MITLNSGGVKVEVKNKVIYTIFIRYLKEKRNRFQNLEFHLKSLIWGGGDILK